MISCLSHVVWTLAVLLESSIRERNLGFRWKTQVVGQILAVLC